MKDINYINALKLRQRVDTWGYPNQETFQLRRQGLFILYFNLLLSEQNLDSEELAL